MRNCAARAVVLAACLGVSTTLRAQSDAPVVDPSSAEAAAADVDHRTPVEPEAEIVDEAAESDVGEQPALPGASARDAEAQLDSRTVEEEEGAVERVPAQHPAVVPEIATAAGTSTQRPWHLRAGVDARPLLALEPSLDALALSDTLMAGGVSLEGEWDVTPDIPLVVQLEYAGSVFGGSLFRSMQATSFLHSAWLGAQVGYRVWEFLTPTARAGLALSWVHVALADGGQEIGAWAFAPGGFAMLGVEACLARRWLRAWTGSDQLTAGLRAEAGYLYLGSFRFGEQRVRVEGQPEVYTPALGTLTLAGPAARLGLLVSY